MDEAFTTRLAALLAANPRIDSNGCGLVVKQKVSPTQYILVDKPDEPYKPCPSEITRIYQLTLYIKDPPTLPRGRMLVGSYGWKHVLEKLPWKEGKDTYVSNTEGIVAMMMCGYKPRWSKDPQSPNCVFSIDRKWGREMITEAERCYTQRWQRPNPPPPPHAEVQGRA